MSIDAVKKFINQVEKSKKARGKELRLTLDDAGFIVNGIAELMTKNSDMYREVIKLQKKIIEIQTEEKQKNEDRFTLLLDAGGFKSKS